MLLYAAFLDVLQDQGIGLEKHRIEFLRNRNAGIFHRVPLQLPNALIFRICTITIGIVT